MEPTITISLKEWESLQALKKERDLICEYMEHIGFKEVLPDLYNCFWRIQARYQNKAEHVEYLNLQLSKKEAECEKIRSNNK